MPFWLNQNLKYFYSLTKPLFWRERKLKCFYGLTKKLFWLKRKLIAENYKNLFYRLTKKAILNNFYNQEISHHMHFLGYVLHHQSMIKKFCLFQRLLFYDSYFGFYSLNASNIYYSPKHLCIHSDILFQQHFIFTAFLCSVLSPNKNEYFFGFNPTNSLIAKPAVSSFILPTSDLFKS